MTEEDGTEPLDATYVQTVEHHGRLFQHYAVTQGAYFAPIDEWEISRLELMHSIFSIVFDDRLIFPPVRSPRRILDCGCGGGHWAVAVAQQYPQSEILAIDISPHMMPDDAPDNLVLQVDDLNKRFTFPHNHFDVIHSQMVAGGIHANRWQSYIRDMYRALRPGGWCQMVEIYFNAQSDNGSLSRDHALSRWSRQYLDGLHPYKNPRAPLQLSNWMRNAGFTEVDTRLIPLPMCGWSSDAREHHIGELNKSHVSELLHTLGLYPMTRFRGLSIGDFEELVNEARVEAANASLKPYFPL
ncbi:methyltransferase domain-containing protein [Sarocladium implicatum]|nr:methyltransferase domain-containing protein [Sarocladium implicatum]